MEKCKTIKQVEDRDEQFKNIEQLCEQYRQAEQPIISIDEFKKRATRSFISSWWKFIHNKRN